MWLSPQEGGDLSHACSLQKSEVNDCPLTRWMLSGVMALDGSDLMKNTHTPVRATSFPSVTNTLGFFIFAETGFTPPEKPNGPANAKQFQFHKFHL